LRVQVTLATGEQDGPLEAELRAFRTRAELVFGDAPAADAVLVVATRPVDLDLRGRPAVALLETGVPAMIPEDRVVRFDRQKRGQSALFEALLAVPRAATAARLGEEVGPLAIVALGYLLVKAP
jgi:hypothetical protein